MLRDDGDNSSLTELLVCTHTDSQGQQTSELMLLPMESLPPPTTSVLGLILLFICTTSEAATYMCLPKTMAADNVHLLYQALTQSPFYNIIILL